MLFLPLELLQPFLLIIVFRLYFINRVLLLSDCFIDLGK